MRERLDGIRAILISEHNLKLLGTRYSYDEYAEFFDAELSPLEIPEELILDEPTDDYPTDIDDLPESEEEEDAEFSEDAEEEEGAEEAEEEDDDDWLP
jgi:hypothetical protein